MVVVAAAVVAAAVVAAVVIFGDVIDRETNPDTPIAARNPEKRIDPRKRISIGRVSFPSLSFRLSRNSFGNWKDVPENSLQHEI